MKLVSIILPTYNEADNIIPLIKGIDAEIKTPKEIIVVDDNSPDGTSQTVHAYIKKHKTKHIFVETRYSNRGLTNSIQHGINKAHGDVVVWMDCDFSHPPEVIPHLLTKINDGYDVSVGSRFIPGGKAKSEGPRDSIIGIILSNVLNFLMQFLLGNKFHDYTSGFVAVRKSVFNKIQLRGDYGEYFIDFIVKAYAYKFKVIEIPFVSKPRRAGESKTGQSLFDYIKRGKKYILLVIRLLWETRVEKNI